MCRARRLVLSSGGRLTRLSGAGCTRGCACAAAAAQPRRALAAAPDRLGACAGDLCAVAARASAVIFISPVFATASHPGGRDLGRGAGRRRRSAAAARRRRRWAASGQGAVGRLPRACRRSAASPAWRVGWWRGRCCERASVFREVHVGEPWTSLRDCRPRGHGPRGPLPPPVCGRPRRGQGAGGTGGALRRVAGLSRLYEED